MVSAGGRSCFRRKWERTGKDPTEVAKLVGAVFLHDLVQDGPQLDVAHHVGQDHSHGFLQALLASLEG
jgi:hypothetical protein